MVCLPLIHQLVLEVNENVDEYALDLDRFMPTSAFWREHAPAVPAAPSKAARDKATQLASASSSASAAANDQEDFENDDVPASVKRGKSAPLVAAPKQPSAKVLAEKEKERRSERSFQYPIRIADVMFSLERDQGVALSSADAAVPIERYWCGLLCSFSLLFFPCTDCLDTKLRVFFESCTSFWHSLRSGFVEAFATTAANFRAWRPPPST